MPAVHADPDLRRHRRLTPAAGRTGTGEQQGAVMTYQPYPAGSRDNEAASIAGRPPQPSALRNAVRLMWVGAAVAVVGVIVTLAFSSKIKSAVTKAAIKAN